MKANTTAVRLVPLLVVLLLATIGSVDAAPNYPVRVGLELGASQVTIASVGDVVVENAGNQPLGHLNGTFSARPAADGVHIGNHVYPGSIVVRLSLDRPSLFDGRGYRGDLMLHQSTPSNLDVVNRLDLEDYIWVWWAGRSPRRGLPKP